MICSWGMSEKLGPVSYPLAEPHPFLGKEMASPRTFSEKTAQLIDEEIRELIVELEQKAESILQENRPILDALADALVAQESLDAEAVDRILSGRS
jgi:cell division protease FtsH